MPKALGFAAPLMWCVCSFASQGASAAERILPIRGEELLGRLAQPTVTLGEVRLSPDGSKLLYVEGRREGAGHVTGASTGHALWMLDTASGQRFKLQDQPQGLATLRAGSNETIFFNPQWSVDGRRVATLEWRDRTLSLVSWNAADGAATRTALGRFSEQVMPAHEIYNWLWLSERNELVLGVRPLPKPPAVSVLGPDDTQITADSPQGYVWTKSRAVAATDAKFRGGASLKRITGDVVAGSERPLQIYVVRLAAQSYQEVKLAETIYTARDFRPLSNLWKLDRSRERILFSGRDQAAEMLESRSLGALYALELRTRTVRKLYSGYPIPDFCTPRDGKRIVAAVRDPALSAGSGMLAGFSFGRIEWLGSTPRNGSSIVADPVNLSSVLHASDRADSVYQVESTTPERRIFEVLLASGRRQLLSPRDVSVSDADVSADGKNIVAVLENVNTPPDIHLWTRAQPRWRKLTDHGAGYRDPGVATIEKITWRSKDDRFDIDGFLFKPRDFDPAKKYPLLTLVHGGPGASYRNRFNPMLGNGGAPAHVLAAEGYLVLLPNLRGDAGYTLEFSRAILGNVGKDWEYDLEAGIDRLIARGSVDPDQLGLDGMSWGGQQVLYAISHTNRYKAAVRNDPQNINEVYYPYLYYFFPGTTDFRDRVYRDNADHFGFDPARERWADISKIRTPLLVRWGMEGMMTPAGTVNTGFDASNPGMRNVVESAMLYNALTRNGVPVEILVDRDGHGVSNLRYMVEYQSRLLQWFDWFLLGKGENPLPAMKSPVDYGAEPSTSGAPESSATPMLAKADSARSQVATVAFTAVEIDTATEVANASVGDVDGDGDVDIVLARGRHTALADLVLLNDGHGRFEQRSPLGKVADRSYAAVLADLDGDGDLDVVVGNDAPDEKRVYLNNGRGQFTAAGTFGSARWWTRNVTVVDVNGDRRPDLVIANRAGEDKGSSGNHLCINDGHARFTRCTLLSSESATTIAAGDFNGDGAMDLVVPHRDGGQSYLFMNDGRGGFSDQRALGPANSATRAVAVGDVDGDGRADIVIGDEARGGASLYLNRDGRFGSAVTLGEAGDLVYSIAIADMDGDGAADIVLGNRERPGVILINQGKARSFRRVAFGDGRGAVYGLAIADVNADGRLDIVAARSGAPSMLYLGAAL